MLVGEQELIINAGTPAEEVSKPLPETAELAPITAYIEPDARTKGRHFKRLIAASTAVLALGGLAGCGKAASGNPPSTSGAEQSTSAPLTPSSGSTAPATSSTETSPSSSETASASGLGNIDLTTKAAGESYIHFENGAVKVLASTFPASAKNIANAWLSQYAYILYRGTPSNGPSRGFDDNVHTVEAAMASGQGVLDGLQNAVDYYRANVGVADVMPIFWDSAEDPVTFTESTDSAGNTVVTFGEDSGPLYFNTYDPNAPWNDSNNDKWQDPHGRDAAKATKVTNFKLVIDGANSDGFANIVGWKVG